jgi:hypothetical protein
MMLINTCSSTIIEDVSIFCQLESSRGIAYFYFDFNNPQKQRYENLVRSLIIQFYAQCPHTPNALAMIYSQNHNGNRQPNTDDLMTMLEVVIRCFEHSYIIIDALDECVEQDDLLNWIGKVVDWRLDSLHMLATSREEQDIKDCLGPRFSGQIRIQSTLIDQDILLHVRQTLQSDTKLKKWPEKVHREIEETLMEGADGMQVSETVKPKNAS